MSESNMGESDAAPMPGSAQDANGDTAIVGTASQVARQIQVQYDLKLGPERHWDWCAYRDDDPDSPHGYGPRYVRLLLSGRLSDEH